MAGTMSFLSVVFMGAQALMSECRTRCESRARCKLAWRNSVANVFAVPLQIHRDSVPQVGLFSVASSGQNYCMVSLTWNNTMMKP